MAGTYPIQHTEIVAQCLTALGRDTGDPPEYDVLAAGASGANVYRLRGAFEDLVLKVTRPERAGYLHERADREIRFYRHLARDVGLGVPRMLGSCRSEGAGACLLLEACEPPPDPQAWTAARYAEAAELLGRFHARFWGKTEDLSGLRWLRTAEEPGEGDIGRAIRHWERLRVERRFATVLTPERFQRITGMLDRVPGASAATSSLPLTLCHGDFHIGNILVDRGGGMLVADWQEVGLGRGPEDLSFFIQRASSAGGTVPGDAIINAYRRSLSAHLSVDAPERDIRRVMELAELRTRLLHWPAFLTDASERQVMMLIERIEVLAAKLGIAAT